MNEDCPEVAEEFTDPPSSVFKLDIYKHIPFVNPEDYKLKDVNSIDPHKYFITSGDAVEKTRVMERDLWDLASELRRLIKTRPEIKEYEKKVWSAAGKARALLNRLTRIKLICDALFLETEWSDHVLYLLAKNPRKKEEII